MPTSKQFERIVLISLGLMILWAMSLWTYNSFFNEDYNSDKIITFNVTGIEDSVNATTLVSIHFECIKYCKQIANSVGGTYLQKCWDECASLGKEECNNEK